MPLKSIIPESKAKEMVERQRRRVEERKDLPAGLKEPYELQLKALESNNGADVEVTHIPGLVSNVGMMISVCCCASHNEMIIHLAQPEPGKKYITIGPVINHPFSRGYVVTFFSDS